MTNYKTLELDPKYVPKKSEPYISLEQQAYFYQQLMSYKADIEEQMAETLNSVITAGKEASPSIGEDYDNLTLEQERDTKMRMSQRNEQLMKKINAALERLENGKYGYSLVSGDEIGIKRLMAAPWATMTIEEREEYEKRR